MNPIDDVLEQLQDLLDSSKPIMFTESVKVDKARFEEIIYNFRTSLPDAIKDAEEIVLSCDQYISQATDDAQKIVNEAEIEAQRRISEHEVYVRAVDAAEEHMANTNEEVKSFCAENLKNVDEILADASRKIAEFSERFERQYEDAKNTLDEYMEEVYLMRKSLRGEQ